MLSYVDVFEILSIVIFGSLLFVLLTRGPNPGAAKQDPT